MWMTLIILDFANLNSAAGQPSNIANNPEPNSWIDLKNQDHFIWKPFIHAKVFQNDHELSLIVDTSSKNKLYNRAYMDTELNNLTKPPIALLLNYSYKSEKESTIFYLEIRDKANNNPLASYSLNEEATVAIVPLKMDITNKPIEFRLYAITNEPTFCLLIVKEARLLLDV